MSDELSLEEINAIIAQYERDSGWVSEEFLRRVGEGTAPDTFEAMDWQILLGVIARECPKSHNRHCRTRKETDDFNVDCLVC